jgi:transposase
MVLLLTSALPRLFHMEVLTGDPIVRRRPVRAKPAFRKPLMDVTQGEMFPQSLDEMVDADDACRYVSALVDQLDLSCLTKDHSLQGGVSYPPRLMLKLWMFALWDAERSSRRIEKRCRTDIRYRWLCQGLVPDHTTLCRFRRALGSGLDELIMQSVRLGQQAGLRGMGRASIDGTKIPSAASQWATFRMEAESADAEIPMATGKEKKKREPLPSKDPDARTMRNRQGQYITGYNAQCLVDEESGLITTVCLSNEASDAALLEPTLAKCLQTSGELPCGLLADSGYDTPANAYALAQTGIDAWIACKERKAFWRLDEQGRPICPQGHVAEHPQRYMLKGVKVLRLLVDECPACPRKKQCLAHEDSFRKTIALDARFDMAAWLGQKLRAVSPEGKEELKKRGQTVEFAFARMKGHFGLRRLMLWKMEGAQIEVSMVALVANLATIARNLGPQALKDMIRCLLRTLYDLAQATQSPIYSEYGPCLPRCVNQSQSHPQRHF